jgi:DUF4097 and DUF4098 domain-containing protein YvlB
MKTRNMIAAFLAALLVVGAAAGLAAAREEETIKQSYEAGKNPRLSLKNINGDVRIEGGEGRTFEVTAIKSADSKQDLEDADIHFRMDDGRLQIEVDYDDDGWFHHHEAVRIDFTLTVPRGVRIDTVELVNGDLLLRAIDGGVEASSVNGDVSGEALGGAVELSAVNGDVSLVASGGSDSIDLSSVNGGVSLVLPADFDASIEASTVHGEIRSTGGLDVQTAKWVGSSVKGSIGKGAGTRIELDTVNGSIDIRHDRGAATRGKDN